MNALTAIQNRQSVRCYYDREVDELTVQKLVEACDSGPYAGPYQLTVVLNKDVLQKLDGLTIEAMKNSPLAFLRELAETPGYHPLFGAPGMIVFSAPSDNPYGMANCAAGAAIGSIAATALSLGSCFAVTPTMALNAHPEICKQIGVPDKFVPLCTLMFGYIKDPFAGRPPQKAKDNVTYYK